MIVSVHWADAERGGLRTLRVHGTSLDDVFRVILKTLRRTCRNGSETPASSGGAKRDVSTTARHTRNGGRQKRRSIPSRWRAAGTDGGRDAGSGRSGAGAPRNGSVPPPGPPTIPSQVLAARILWTGEVPAGRFLPAATLIQTQVRSRRIMLRVPGQPQFEIGMLVNLGGLRGSGQFFEAELYNDAENAVTLYLKERLI